MPRFLGTLRFNILVAMPLASLSALPPATPAATLAGRVAGKPMDCISDFESDRGGAIYASGDILYRGRGSRLYVNHPDHCPALGPNRLIVSRTPTGQQCRGDIFEVHDQTSPISYGSCALGAFIPYDKPRR